MARSTCGGIYIVICWLHVLLTLCNARRSRVLAPPLHNSALCRTGSSSTTSSILSQIRQARDCEVRCLHHCLLPWDENKNIDRDRDFSMVAIAAQTPEVGRLLCFGFHWGILGVFCVCVCLTDQGSGHHKAQGLAALLPFWLMSDLA